MGKVKDHFHRVLEEVGIDGLETLSLDEAEEMERCLTQQEKEQAIKEAQDKEDD